MQQYSRDTWDSSQLQDQFRSRQSWLNDDKFNIKQWNTHKIHVLDCLYDLKIVDDRKRYNISTVVFGINVTEIKLGA